MAHVLREHAFVATLMDNDGCRVSDPQQEAEATELSGELLLPFEAAKLLAFDGVSDAHAAERFGVSIEFARWRMQSTGARIIAQRARAKRDVRH
jgi:Zn-dependent peptidase ImmA (M78 family)